MRRELRSPVAERGSPRYDVGFPRAVSYAYSAALNGARETHNTRGLVKSGRSGLEGLVTSNDNGLRALFQRSKC